MKITAIIICLLTILSCSGLERFKKVPECAALIESIQKDWSYDAKSDLFKIGSYELEVNFAKSRDCLKGIKRSTVKKLFGQPQSETKSRFGYMLTNACKGVNGVATSGCSYLRVDFSGENSRVTDMGISDVKSSH